jgi:trimeric autotransporter adhesin
LQSNTIGEFNTAIGYAAGGDQINALHGSFFGYNASASVNGLNNVTAIGYGSLVNAHFQIRIGNADVGSIGGYEDWTDLSDMKFKSNIREDVPGLEFIMKLRPVTYTLSMDELSAFIGEDRKDDTLRMDNQVVENGRETKSRVRRTGFLAQEVESSAIETGFDFNGVDKPANEKGTYGLRYAKFTVPLVKAVQEQQLMIEDLRNTIETQQRVIEELSRQHNIMQDQIRGFIDN